MFRATMLVGKAGSRNVAKYLAEYYQQDAAIMPAGKWIGAAAERLNLNAPGRNLKNDIRAVIEGKDPNTGKKLTKGREERLGYDLTFSDEKDFSILAATASPEMRKAIIDAHVKAVEETLAIGLPLVLGRWGKDGKHKAQADAPVRLVHHMDSRAGDPQLHTHALLPNLCRAGDRWLTIDAKELKTAEIALGVLFRDNMAKKIEALGFTVESVRETGQGDRATGEVWHRVAGISDEVRQHFSKRDEEITATAEAEGISRDRAAQKTRQHKTEQNSATAVIENAQAWLKENGHDLKADNLKSRARERAAFTPRNRAAVLASLHDHESSFTVWDFVAAEAKEGRVYTSKEQALDALERGHDCDRTPDGERFISRAQRALEDGITRDALARKDVGHKLEAATVETAIKEHELKSGFQLDAGQRKAVEHVCAGGGTSLIVGRAGTGKTATAGAYMGAFEAAGYDVVSVSTATKAANNLQRETEREASNFAQLIQRLDSGKTKLTDKSVIVIDEAGMVSARDWAAVQKHADAAGAKIIAIGDEKQLQPVGAGTPFRDLLAELEPATLGNIRRQRGALARAIAEAFYEGKTGEDIVKSWEAGGMLTTHADRDDARAALVADYNSNPAGAKDKLIIVPTHAEAAAINGTIRQQRQQDGELGEERAVRAWVDGGKAEAGIRLAVGDRVRFTANDGGRGKQYVNGEAGEVVGWGKDTIRIKLETDAPNRNGQIIELQTTGKPLDVVPGYAQTLHSTQGLGAESVYYLPGANIDRNAALVGHTRTKGQFHMYAADGDREQIAAGVDEWRYKVSARELMAGALAVGVADAQAQQQHEQRLAHERKQAQEIAGDPATWKAAEKCLADVAAEAWAEAANDPRRGEDMAGLHAFVKVQAVAGNLLPMPPIDPARIREAEARAGIPERAEKAREAQERAQEAVGALDAAGAVIRPAVEEMNRLKATAEKDRAGAQQAQKAADRREKQILNSQDDAKGRAACQRVLDGGKWGWFDKTTKSLKSAIDEVKKDREAQERREKRARVAELKQAALMEKWKPEIETFKAARDVATVATREADEQRETLDRWRTKVAAEMPERQQHEQRVRQVVDAVVKTVEAPYLKRQEEYARQRAQAKERQAQEQAAEKAQQAAYERDHPQQSRGYGGMSW